jgi:hypothetical protein
LLQFNFQVNIAKGKNGHAFFLAPFPWLWLGLSTFFALPCPVLSCLVLVLVRFQVLDVLMMALEAGTGS